MVSRNRFGRSSHTRTARAGGQGGFTLVELLTYVFIVGLIAAVVGGVVVSMLRSSQKLQAFNSVVNAQTEASMNLFADVTDGSTIVVARPDEFTVNVLRDNRAAGSEVPLMLCEQRNYRVVASDEQPFSEVTVGSLVVTTTVFESSSCVGATRLVVSEVFMRDVLLVGPRGDSARDSVAPVFSYSRGNSELSAQAAEANPGVVSLVTWDLRGISLRANPDVEVGQAVAFKTAASFSKRSDTTSGSGELDQVPATPSLSVRTGKGPTTGVSFSGYVGPEFEGFSAPRVSWVDHTGLLTCRWVIWRAAYPVGETPVELSWSQVMGVGNFGVGARNEREVREWVDVSLPAGWTAHYQVVAVVDRGLGCGDGVGLANGPGSNVVETGLAPVAPVIETVGSVTGLSVSWLPVAGADRYDVYRRHSGGVDQFEFVEVVDGATSLVDGRFVWVDGSVSSRGVAHEYVVVASNVWERSGSVVGAAGVPVVGAVLGEPWVTDLGSAAAGVRLGSNRSGGWTAPLQPVVSASIRLPSAQSNPSSVWDATTDVSWTTPVWVGGFADEAGAATRFRVERQHALPGGSTVSEVVYSSTSLVDIDDPGAARGVRSDWRVTAVAGGLESVVGVGGVLAWPSAPSCDVPAGERTSRSLVVGVSATSAQTSQGQVIDKYRARLVGRTKPDGSTYVAPDRTVFASAIKSVGTNFLSASGQGGSSILVDGLPHNTRHSFSVQVGNSAGWGPFRVCANQNTLGLSPGLSLSTAASDGKITSRSLRATSTKNVDSSSVSMRQYIKLASASSWGSGATAASGVVSAEFLWDRLVHDSSYQLKTVLSDGFNTVESPVVSRSTYRLSGTVGRGDVTTRSVEVLSRKSPVSSSVSMVQQLRVKGGSSWASVTAGSGLGGSSTPFTGFWDRLSHNTVWEVRTVVSDGHNTVESPVIEISTDRLTVGISGATRTTSSVSANVSASPAGTTVTTTLGGARAQSGTGLKSWTGLSPSTSYVVRATNSDGYNSVQASTTVTTSTPATAIPSNICITVNHASNPSEFNIVTADFCTNTGDLPNSTATRWAGPSGAQLAGYWESRGFNNFGGVIYGQDWAHHTTGQARAGYGFGVHIGTNATHKVEFRVRVKNSAGAVSTYLGNLTVVRGTHHWS